MPSGGDRGVFKTAKQMIDPEKTNIVILTNKKTASASEFLAGAFQDLDKGVIIGNDKSTLGKVSDQMAVFFTAFSLKGPIRCIFFPFDMCGY